MSTSWAIIIGINQYQGFQPLMQAQNDAVAVRRYLIEDAGFTPENCILLSDLSTSIEQEAVFPDRTAINDWLETICQGRVQQDDTLWFYFSGYGAQADNRDYLMPVDGDPAQVKQTGIALQDVVKHLKQAPTNNVMMVLDINRSMSALAGQAIGSQVVKLAEKSRIPLILSCQPNQFSHETLAVRHGIFTKALLEGLNYDGCATLSHLDRYLAERVPELCEHHWRPLQNPVFVLPEEHKFKLLWHQRDRTGEAVNTEMPMPVDSPEEASLAENGFLEEDFDTPGFDASELDATDYGAAAGAAAGAVAIGGLGSGLIPDNPEGVDAADDLIPEDAIEFNLDEDLPEEDTDLFQLDPDADENTDDYGTTLVDDVPDDPETNKASVGGCLGGLAALIGILLLGGVFLRNQPAVQTALDQIPSEWQANLGLDSDAGNDGTSPENPDNADATAGTPGDGAAPDEASTDEASTDEASSVGDSAAAPDGQTAAETEATDTEADGSAAAPDSENADATADDAETAAADAAPDAAADADNGGVTPDNPDAAADNAAAEDTAEGEAPASEEKTPTGVAAVGNTVPGAASSGTDTATLLEDARRSLRPSQASRFASAIATARQIPSSDPNYEAAQTDIRRWSQVILDLAEGRAAETELQAAIDAAQLVPREPADIRTQAQERIDLWQVRLKTRNLIREAQAIPRMGQASTYQKGILRLQQDVPESQPVEYADAQRLIGEWTEKMLMIAKARAAQGRYGSAIEAAKLIPANTPNYDQAQAEIKRWQGQ